MMGLTILFLLVGLVSPFIGRIVDRYGARKVICFGSVTAGLGYVLLYRVDSLWQFYLGCIIIGLGLASMGPVPVSAIVSNWFHQKRGLAIGLMSTGMGMGGFVMAPLIGGYLIPGFGWRMSYLVLAVIIWAVIIPLALLVIKTRPEDLGLCPLGAENHRPEVSPALPVTPGDGLTLKKALATASFWLIGVSFFINNFSHGGTIQSQVPYLEDMGFPAATTATAIGMVGLMSAIGKLGFGWLCDRMRANYACAIGLTLQAAGILILLNVGPTSSLAQIWLYAIVLGLGVGSWLPCMSILTSTSFGMTAYGSIFGSISLMQNVGLATGPLLGGYLFDRMQTYHLVFIIFMSLYAIALTAVLVLKRRKTAD